MEIAQSGMIAFDLWSTFVFHWGNTAALLSPGLSWFYNPIMTGIGAVFQVMLKIHALTCFVRKYLCATLLYLENIPTE